MSAFDTRYEDQQHLASEHLLTRQRQEAPAFSDFLLPFPDSDPNIVASASTGLGPHYSSYITPPTSIGNLSTIGAVSTNEESNASYIPERASHSWNMSSNGYPDFLGQYDGQITGSSSSVNHNEANLGRYTAFNSLGQLVSVSSTQDAHITNKPSWDPLSLISLDPEDENWVECTEALIKSTSHVGHVYRVQGWSPSEGQGKAKRARHSTAESSHNRTDSVEVKQEPSTKSSPTKWARRGAPSSGISRKKRDASGAFSSSAQSQSATVPSRTEELPSDFSIKLYDPWASSRNAMVQGDVEHPASAPPDVVQLRYADISQLQANPDPQLARYITMAASRTLIGQELPNFQGGQYLATHVPNGIIGSFHDPSQIESSLTDQSSQTNLNTSVQETPALAQLPQPQNQYTLPMSSTIPTTGILPLSRPMHALDYSSSTRRRALQRSITSGPGQYPQRFQVTTASVQEPPNQVRADISTGTSESLASRPSFPGPQGRPVSEGIIPNIATSLKTSRGLGISSSRTLLDDISAAVGPVAKRARYS